jgi:hypothetical protein
MLRGGFSVGHVGFGTPCTKSDSSISGCLRGTRLRANANNVRTAQLGADPESEPEA